MAKKKATQIDHLSISYPAKDFTESTLENLRRMVAAKEPLIKMALGAEALPINVTGETVEFDWFKIDTDEGIVNCYAQFICNLCKTAQEKKRVTAHEREEWPNPRFSFRVWLISLGMVGDEYKAARKALCAGLSGNAAWASGVDPRRKTAPNAAPETAE
ncbi:MAG: hypothetical protein LBG83_01710 [Oscillospiraceae bacterium]|jgi:hypothetical protein|nr:hypothetical protein [Oscillospiraceae bacterium]